MGDLETVKEMLQGRDLSSMTLDEIADLIRKDWKKVHFAAKPYLDALGNIDSRGMFMEDPWSQIVAYFLSNATSWRGPVAKEVKAELNKRLKKNSWLPKAASKGVLDKVAALKEIEKRLAKIAAKDSVSDKRHMSAIVETAKDATDLIRRANYALSDLRRIYIGFHDTLFPSGMSKSDEFAWLSERIQYELNELMKVWKILK
jgi:hypothetical protein